MRWLSLARHGGPLTPQDLWTAWDTSLLLPIGVAALVYAWGLANLWRRVGAGHGLFRRRGLSFLGAILALVVALVSPLESASSALFSAHMIQHLILILVAAPLLIMSDFPLALLWALPRRASRLIGPRLARSRLLGWMWRLARSPVFAWSAFTVAMWLWHAPALYQAALRDDRIHAVEHSALLGSALLFWWVLLRHSAPDAVHYGLAIPYLFATFLQSGILGALMTFSPQPWYPDYVTRTVSWGLTPLEDQQLAGLMMWLPAGAVFALLTIGYFAAWLRALEKRSLRPRSPDILRISKN